MSARAFKDAIAALLVGDAAFAAAVAAALGVAVTTVISSNTPVDQIAVGDWPCFVIEQADGVAASISNDGDDTLTIGNYQQTFESDLDVLLLWHDEDREHAADARSDLSTLFAQLLLRHPTPGGIQSAWLQSWKSDQGTRHPMHIFAAQLRGQYAIPLE